MLVTVEPIPYRFDQSGDGLNAADRGRLVDHLHTSVGTVDALKVDAPLLIPLEAVIGKLRNVGHLLRNSDEALADRPCSHRRSRCSRVGTSLG